MFRPDIPGKHRDVATTLQANRRTALKMDFIPLRPSANLLVSDRDPFSSQWDVWGKTIIWFSFSLPERRMEEWVGPELCPV